MTDTEINRFLNILRGAIIGLLIAVPSSFGYMGIKSGTIPLLLGAFGSQVLGGILLVIWIGVTQRRIQKTKCQQ